MADKPVTATRIRPDRGGLTFDSEGTEGGRFHSRSLHVPNASSGLTIGRGYEMGSKRQRQIAADWVAAGVDAPRAKLISGAASLRGENAKKFIKDNELEDFEISQQSQKALFDMTYRVEEESARVVCQRADAKYGKCNWDALNPAIRELIVDLEYRGDYTPASRKLIQPLIVANDLDGLTKVMADQSNWPSVPQDRFQRRKAFMESANGK